MAAFLIHPCGLKRSILALILCGAVPLCVSFEAQAADETGSGSCTASNEMAALHEEAAQAAQGIAGAKSASVKALLQKWGETRQSCNSQSFAAQKECLEACSKNAQKGLSNSGTLTGLLQGLAGAVAQTCGLQQQAASAMKQGYTDYSQACKAGQSACNKSCGEAQKIAESLLKELKMACQDLDPGQQTPCRNSAEATGKIVSADIQSKNSQYVAGKLAQCSQKFSQLLSGAGEVLANLGGMMAAGKICGQDSSASSADAAPSICDTSPFSPGCPGAPNEEQTPMISGSTFGGGPTQNAEDIPEKSNAPNFGNTNGSPGSAGAGGGYDAGGLGAAAAPAGAGKDSQKAKSKFNANILSGEGGGGGGGGWNGMGASSMRSGESGGGTGARSVRGLANERKEPSLTGAGGRDNFYKIKMRYTDNTPTLLYDL